MNHDLDIAFPLSVRNRESFGLARARRARYRVIEDRGQKSELVCEMTTDEPLPSMSDLECLR